MPSAGASSSAASSSSEAASSAAPRPAPSTASAAGSCTAARNAPSAGSSTAARNASAAGSSTAARNAPTRPPRYIAAPRVPFTAPRTARAAGDQGFRGYLYAGARAGPGRDANEPPISRKGPGSSAEED